MFFQPREKIQGVNRTPDAQHPRVLGTRCCLRGAFPPFRCRRAGHPKNRRLAASNAGQGRHEQSERQLSEKLTPPLSPSNGAGEQQTLFTPIDREVLDALRAADLDQLRPIDALNLLAQLKKQIS